MSKNKKVPKRQMSFETKIKIMQMNLDSGQDLLEKKLSYEEKLKVVRFCLDHNRNIRETAELYGLRYAHVYQWVRKYEAGGEDALIDRRGKRGKGRRTLLLEEEQAEYDRENELERLRKEAEGENSIWN
ncbi:helix-turn-helix domain-containing protein [Butyrivibrio sp. WCD3002]|uniref:helix-turn-helix domain-containing protein n=1 Tax=Butyrivibrio sp. WCD3002 TaxID=1280676 RepID=UPI00041DC9B0|nr:helix-turn-helix domain-containing protein [Butyrivibrio sp. WCD3002]